MKSELIETGRIVNTHGIDGRLRLQLWADTPDVLTNAECIYIDGQPVKVLSAQVHKNVVIVSLESVGNIDAAIKLKNKIVSVKRSDINLEAGTFFIADLVGLTAIDADTGSALGEVADILTLPANNVYVIKGSGGREILVPAVPEFIKETNIEEGFVKIHLIEGL